jgi:hypothetical protein
MNFEAVERSSSEESRPAPLARMFTWIGILIGAASFWLLAGWLVWSYSTP